MSDEVYGELFALGQCMPGPTSTQVSFAIGVIKKGVRGEWWWVCWQIGSSKQHLTECQRQYLRPNSLPAGGCAAARLMCQRVLLALSAASEGSNSWGGGSNPTDSCPSLLLHPAPAAVQVVCCLVRCFSTLERSS
jgi:hypothetical protein